MITAVIKWFQELQSKDPVHACEVYKKIGCAHVDGIGCSIEACSILRKHQQEPKE